MGGSGAPGEEGGDPGVDSGVQGSPGRPGRGCPPGSAFGRGCVASPRTKDPLSGHSAGTQACSGGGEAGHSSSLRFTMNSEHLHRQARDCFSEPKRHQTQLFESPQEEGSERVCALQGPLSLEF